MSDVGGIAADREVWLPVVGYEGYYEVSNLGRLRRDAAASPRTEIIQPCGGDTYPVVSLSRNGEVRTHRLHKLVLTAFCGPAPFEGAHAAHNDGDKANCRLTNLRWATPAENQADVDRHGRRCRGAEVFGAKLEEADIKAIRQRIAKGERNPGIARDFAVSISTIHLIRHNRIWRHV